MQARFEVLPPIPFVNWMLIYHLSDLNHQVHVPVLGEAGRFRDPETRAQGVHNYCGLPVRGGVKSVAGGPWGYLTWHGPGFGPANSLAHGPLATSPKALARG